MKIGKDRRAFTVVLALSLFIITMAAGHGCGISSYEGKKITSVSIDPADVTIAAETVQQFTAIGHYADSTTVDLSSSATWTTSDPLVATVSTAGLATAVASSGTCTVSATSEGMTASAQLTVKNLPLQSITVSPNAAITNKGLPVQFKAAGLFSSGTDTINQDITTLVSWNSSTTSVATIDPAGLATGVSAGTTDITAQLKGITSPAAALTVSNAALLSISVTTPSIFLNPPPTVQLTATGTFDDSTTRDITAQVVWSSESPDVATVDSSGLVTAGAAGPVTITATAGGKTGSITLVVKAAGTHG